MRANRITAALVISLMCGACAGCGPTLAQVRMEPVGMCAGADCGQLVLGEGGRTVQVMPGDRICTHNCVRLRVETWSPKTEAAYRIVGAVIGGGIGVAAAKAAGGNSLDAILVGGSGTMLGEALGQILAP